MTSTAESLAQWASALEPTEQDLQLARRSLLDTAAVALAAREHPLISIATGLPDAARWAAIGHVLDFDDLHIPSTTHISVVTVPATLAVGGDARAYLAGAGVMARLGELLGWSHYAAGWHATCTAGAPAAAVAAGTALGLTSEQLAVAIALAVPAAGGVQRAFGTHGKSLQVGFAAQAGVRAAKLARAGATADPAALDSWLGLIASGGQPDLSGPAVPDGLAIKVFPCCYAMQRPIAALRDLRAQVRGQVRAVRLRTPESTVQPLIHDRPTSGLEGKFSMPYGVATALLDEYPDFTAFTDDAVNRPQAQELLRRVETDYPSGQEQGLLTGSVDIEIEHEAEPLRISLQQPPGSPARPPSDAELRDKLVACGADVPSALDGAGWAAMRELLQAELPRSDAGD